MFERTNPKTLLNWLILAAVVYLVLPFDLIPDFLGLPGRIDDFALMAWVAWFYRNLVRLFVAAGSPHEAAGASSGERSGQGARSEPRQTKAFDAFSVLGVTRADSSDAIHAAYRARMQEYHPDKVAHLGEELQVLAHEKSLEIQRAYRQLRG